MYTMQFLPSFMVRSSSSSHCLALNGHLPAAAAIIIFVGVVVIASSSSRSCNDCNLFLQRWIGRIGLLLQNALDLTGIIFIVIIIIIMSICTTLHSTPHSTRSDAKDGGHGRLQRFQQGFCQFPQFVVPKGHSGMSIDDIKDVLDEGIRNVVVGGVGSVIVIGIVCVWGVDNTDNTTTIIFSVLQPSTTSSSSSTILLASLQGYQGASSQCQGDRHTGQYAIDVGARHGQLRRIRHAVIAVVVVIIIIVLQ